MKQSVRAAPIIPDCLCETYYVRLRKRGKIMEKEIENHIQNYCSDIQDLFSKIREQIIKCAPEAVEEKLRNN